MILCYTCEILSMMFCINVNCYMDDVYAYSKLPLTMLQNHIDLQFPWQLHIQPNQADMTFVVKNIYSVSLYQATIVSVCTFYNTCCACYLSCTTDFPYTGTGLSSKIGINIILNKTNISIRRSYSVLESICKSTCFEYLIFIPGYILLDESSERQVRLTSVPTINVPI